MAWVILVIAAALGVGWLLRLEDPRRDFTTSNLKELIGGLRQELAKVPEQ